MTMPNVADALGGLGLTERLRIITKTVADFEVVEADKVKPAIWIDGVLEPLNPQRLLVKPEGQRDWQWWTLWTTNRLELDWVVIDNRGVQLRVMNRTDWSQAGYLEYQLIEGPVPA